MKYKSLHKGYMDIKDGGLLNKLLKSRGVDDISKFLNVSGEDVHDGMLFKNMDRGLTMLNYHIERKSKIAILFDVDNDGITSGSLIGHYIKDLEEKIEIKYIMNEGKKHGIIVDNIPKDIDLLIVPDAGSSDIEQHEILYNEYEIDILILDHHIFDNLIDNKYAIVINNQDGKYPNKTLSGAGVTYKFCKEYDKKYGYDYADDYLDLMSIGIIGDCMDLRNYETRYLTLKGLNKINNPLIKEILLKKMSTKNNPLSLDDIEKTYISSVEWDISPCFNACIRSGTVEERNDMIKAIMGEKDDREYKPRKSKGNPNPQIEIHTIEKTMARVFNNIRSRQNKLVSKYMEDLKQKIQENNLATNKIIIVDGTDIINETTFTGLVANKLADYYKRPTLVLKKYKNDIYGGSGRNFNLSPIEDLRQVLLNTKCFESVEGHENAFGIKITQENINKAITLVNEDLKDTKMEDTYMVDYEIPVGRLKPKDILQVGKWKGIWGGEGLKEPLFAITDVTVDIKDIKLLGDKRNFITITKEVGSNSIKFTKCFTNEEEYNRMIMKNKKGISSRNSSKVKMDIIGKFRINEYNGNEYPQIEILDYNVSKAKEFKF